MAALVALVLSQHTSSANSPRQHVPTSSVAFSPKGLLTGNAYRLPLQLIDVDKLHIVLP